MKKISIIIPCYNTTNILLQELKKLEKLMKDKYSKSEYEIILINDGSPQNINNLLDEINKQVKNVFIYELSKNFGQQNALMCGLNQCTGDIILVMDDDGQTKVEEIPKLIGSLNNEVDVAYAKYVHKKHSLFRNIGSKINDFMLVWLLGKPKNLYISSFFAMKSYV